MKNSRIGLWLFVAMTLMVLGACEQPGSENDALVSDAGRLEMGENQNYADLGDYFISVNAQTTDQLSADVAKAYDIPRSKGRAMINVVILKKDPSSPLVSGIPVTGKVNSITRNLTGQLKDMPLREVNEQDAVYYIGQVAVINGETLVFDIDAIPVDSAATLRVRYKHRFFTE